MSMQRRPSKAEPHPLTCVHTGTQTDTSWSSAPAASKDPRGVASAPTEGACSSSVSVSGILPTNEWAGGWETHSPCVDLHLRLLPKSSPRRKRRLCDKKETPSPGTWRTRFKPQPQLSQASHPFKFLLIFQFWPTFRFTEKLARIVPRSSIHNPYPLYLQFQWTL